MSNTRDFSGLKDAEGWSTVRHHKEAPKTMSSFARKPYPAQPPRFSREQYVAEERLRKEEAAKRAEQERRAQSELNEVNFPSLGSAFAEAAPRASAWSKSGKELASAWKEADEENKVKITMEERARKEEEERERRETERYLRAPRYRMTARPDEDTYYEDEEEPPANGGAGYVAPPQDDWTRVEKKTRIRKEHHIVDEEEDAPVSSVWEEEDQSHTRPGRRNEDSIW